MAHRAHFLEERRRPRQTLSSGHGRAFTMTAGRGARPHRQIRGGVQYPLSDRQNPDEPHRDDSDRHGRDACHGHGRADCYPHERLGVTAAANTTAAVFHLRTRWAALPARAGAWLHHGPGREILAAIAPSLVLLSEHGQACEADISPDCRPSGPCAPEFRCA